MTHTRLPARPALLALVAGCLLLPLPAAAQADAAAREHPAGTTAAAGTDTAPDYHLAAGDKLRIEVYKDDQLSQSVQVRPDGKITLPLLGDLVASGRTPAELRDTIATDLKEYMTNPVVTVIVVEATIATAYVMGEVRQPGAVALQRPMTVLQALALAGGVTEFAHKGDIRILRNTPDGVRTIDFDYDDALKGAADARLFLQAGDTVVVP
ncbi:MAG: polysaccharide biosynthesis/export family protein [Vicinamibacterales bacterium]